MAVTIRDGVRAGARTDDHVHPRAAGEGRRHGLPRVDVERYRRIDTTELALVVSIVFAAAFMARGVWLFQARS